jgi:hypothetical protein
LAPKQSWFRGSGSAVPDFAVSIKEGGFEMLSALYLVLRKIHEWSCANLGIQCVQLQHFSVNEGRKLAG